MLGVTTIPNQSKSRQKLTLGNSVEDKSETSCVASGTKGGMSEIRGVSGWHPELSNKLPVFQPPESGENKSCMRQSKSVETILQRFSLES